MQQGLPLEILAQIGPILSLVESKENHGLPHHWFWIPKHKESRERSWLRRELPTYSIDTLEEIAAAGKDKNRKLPHPVWNRAFVRKERFRLSPPNGYDLMNAFRQTARHYFQWCGNDLFIGEGLLVEIHELGLRFPVRHIIRYCHAESLVRGFIKENHALELPDQLDRLHTIYHDLRGILEGGISEGHMHLSSIPTPDESWADYIFSQVNPKHKKAFEPQELRLIDLARVSSKALALSLLIYTLHPSPRHTEHQLPFPLLERLDNLFHAKSPTQLRLLTQLCNKEILHHTLSLLNRSYLKGGDTHTATMNPGSDLHESQLLDLEWLLKILLPKRSFPQFKNLRHSYLDSETHGPRLHIRLLKLLHLKTQTTLLRLDPSPVWRRPIHGSKPRQPNPLRYFIHELFFRYLLFHTFHWQLATQHGTTTGLRRFKTFFDARQRRGLTDEHQSLSLAFDRMVSQKPLHTVEGRVAPPENLTENRHFLLMFAQYFQQNSLKKFGLTVHFIKAEQEMEAPSGFLVSPGELRYGQTRRKTQKQAMRLFRLLGQKSALSSFIVGIDAANLELTTPPEVFAPAFRFLRDYPIELQKTSVNQRTLFSKFHAAHPEPPARLGMTYHVGEDFRHILSGLRAIGEVLEFLNPIPGDRLGHATALALDPIIWLSNIGYQTILPKMEWLDTLVWIHHILGPGNQLIGELSIEDRIQRLSREIYEESQRIPSPWKHQRRSDMEDSLYAVHQFNYGGRDSDLDLSIPTLYDAWRLRQLDPYCISVGHLQNMEVLFKKPLQQSREILRWYDIQREIFEKTEVYVGNRRAYKLLGLYWYNPKVAEIGNERIVVAMASQKKAWTALCTAAQEQLIRLVAKKQLVVEANPTSNRLIGPMATFADHYIFKLTLDKEGKLNPRVPVTINTDNPGIMSTSLTHEYYLLGEVLISAGFEVPYVLEWLDWLRKNGEQYSFVKLIPDQKPEDLSKFFKEFRNRYSQQCSWIEGKRQKYKPRHGQTSFKPKWRDSYG